MNRYWSMTIGVVLDLLLSLLRLKRDKSSKLRDVSRSDDSL